MNSEKRGTTVDGLIAGIIDVQTLVIMALCTERNVEPKEMAKVLLNLKRDEMPDMSEDYIRGRAYAAQAIASTLNGLALPKGAPAGNARPNLAVILGGLAGEHGNTPESVPEK